MAKSFKDKMQQKAANPTMQFISPPEEEKPHRLQIETRPWYEREQGAGETKSRRLQLLLTPSLYEAVKEEAEQRGLSVNEIINLILKDAMRK